MIETAGTALIIFAYICLAVFLFRIIWRIVLWLKIPGDLNRETFPPPKISFLTIVKTGIDIVFLTRLFRVNPLLWVGEWFFHVAFGLVILGHLRYWSYIVHYVPASVLNFEFAGLRASHVLPITLIYILIVKLGIEKRKYFSTGNFFLLLLLFSISVTGLVMTNYIYPNIGEIKVFVTHALAFQTAVAPSSLLFIIHFVIAFIFLAYLPAHIFAAPLTLMEARKHEDGLGGVMHEA